MRSITVKDLPPAERDRWRSFFDHYVFGDDGDPAAHLPEQARGILGRRTPELVARVKALLSASPFALIAVVPLSFAHRIKCPQCLL